MVAIPFHEGRRPYEQIAFQFSHHVIREDGSVAHVVAKLRTLKFREKTLKKFIQHTTENKNLPQELTDSWSPFKLKKGYRAILLR